MLNSLSRRPSSRRLVAVASAVTVAGLSLTANGATIQKADNSTALNDPTSWVQNIVPGAGDIARWDAAVTGPNTVALGGNLSWQGLQIADPLGPVTISTGNTLTLGRSGIDMSLATQDLTINAGVALNVASGRQVWDVATGRTLSLAAAPTRPLASAAGNYAAVLQLSPTGTTVLGTATTNLITDTQGNPFVTVGLNDWAGLNAGTVVASTYAAATTALTAGAVNDVQGSFNTATGTTDVAALRFNDATGRTINAGASNTSRTFTARGILVTPNAGTSAITGNAGANSSFIRPNRSSTTNITPFNVIQHSANDFTISANIANGSSGAPTQLAKSGSGKLILADSFGHGYTGGTVINEGTLQIGNGSTTGSLPGTGGVFNNAALAFNRSDAVLTVANVISGTGTVTQAGSGTVTLGGANTYSGNTNVDAGTLALADNAQLRFVVGAAGVNNGIVGTGALNLAGDFNIDLSAASANVGDSWQLVDNATLAETYAPTFSVLSFVDAGNDVWTKAIDANSFYQFAESTGTLSVVAAAVPEPASLAALGLAGLLTLNRRRKA